MGTRIEWADEVWNPVTGCSPVSEGCRNCYARRMATRLKGRFGYPADDPFRVTFHPDVLAKPLSWKKQRRVFTCSMGDLFHPDVEEGWILDVWLSVRDRPEHTYLILTKRPERALDFLSSRYPKGWERKNVWIGVSVEDQKTAAKRIPLLLQIPAAKRFVSVEPMLGPVNLDFKYYKRWNGVEQAHEVSWALQDLDWVIAGCETGRRARPMEIDWVRDVRDQCVAAGIPFFLKQMEVDGKIVKMPELDGRVWDEVPGGRRKSEGGRRKAGRD